MINQKRLLDIFFKLTQVNSPSYGERDRADVLKDIFEGAGITLKEDDAARALNGNCGNLYAYIQGDAALKPLLFSSHMDTIGSWGDKDIAVTELGIIKTDGNTILGADDCGGLAAITEAALSLLETGGSHRPIELLFTVAEEVYACGAKLVTRQDLKSNEAYIFDLTGSIGTAAYAAPTIMGFECEFTGREAHAGFEPEAGISAIRAASAAVLNIPSGRVGDTTVNVGIIQGGTAGNVVPGRCIIKGEVRSLDHARALDMCHTVLKTAEDAAKEYRAGFSGKLIENARAYKTDTDSNAIRRFKDACLSADVTPELVETYGGSDLNEFCKLGITGIVCACGMYKCHGTSEYSDVFDLIKTAEIAFNLMTDMT